MARSSAARAPKPVSGDTLLAWAEAQLVDARGDLAILRGGSRIWYHRKGEESVDLTEEEIARLERRIERILRVIERKSQAFG